MGKDNELLFGKPGETTLAEKWRPKGVADFVGQPHLWSDGAAFRRLISGRKWHALLVWGPPGTGKSSLVNIIEAVEAGAGEGRKVVRLSAVDAGVADLRLAIENSKHNLEPDIVFVDEVHRLNKGQQDVLLPAVEFRHIRLLAATTENPYHSVNPALRSRALVFELKPHRDSDIVQLMTKILAESNWEFEPKSLQLIAAAAAGDARQAVNFLEALMALSADQRLDSTGLESLSFNRHTGDDRYHDLLSAMIKSLRASAVDAALLYCGSLVANHIDPRIIARRLVIFASEDIGNASPMALVVATSALQAVSLIGYPEARIILGQAVCYLAAAPKSNRAYVAIDAAIADAQQPFAVPEFISTLKRGYVYPHDNPEAARAREYLPTSLKGKRYYEPSGSGHEKSLGLNLEQQGPRS